MCEPTTHRFVRRAFHPTPHHPLECRPEPTPSTPARGGSGLHCRSGASRASSTGGRWSGSAARVLPPICEVSRVVTGTDAGNGGTGANECPSVANSNCLCHQSKRCAVGPRRQKRSDALSEKNEAMKKRTGNWALSEKTKRCAVGSHLCCGPSPWSLVPKPIPVLRPGQPTEHQLNHADPDLRLAGISQVFIILAVNPAPTQPAEGSLHHPPPRQQLKRVQFALLQAFSRCPRQ